MVPVPLVRVNPSSTASDPSPFAKVTTLPSPFPSMVVTCRPARLRTVIAFPEKSMHSTYVPGRTTISSPLPAASIAAWIVAWSSGTQMVEAKPGIGQRTRSREGNA